MSLKPQDDQTVKQEDKHLIIRLIAQKQENTIKNIEQLEEIREQVPANTHSWSSGFISFFSAPTSSTDFRNFFNLMNLILVGAPMVDLAMLAIDEVHSYLNDYLQEMTCQHFSRQIFLKNSYSLHTLPVTDNH